MARSRKAPLLVSDEEAAAEAAERFAQTLEGALNAPGEYDGRTSLHAAAVGGDAAGAAALLAAGADPNVYDRVAGWTPLY